MNRWDGYTSLYHSKHKEYNSGLALGKYDEIDRKSVDTLLNAYGKLWMREYNEKSDRKLINGWTGEQIPSTGKSDMVWYLENKIIEHYSNKSGQATSVNRVSPVTSWEFTLYNDAAATWLEKYLADKKDSLIRKAKNDKAGMNRAWAERDRKRKNNR